MNWNLSASRESRILPLPFCRQGRYPQSFSQGRPVVITRNAPRKRPIARELSPPCAAQLSPRCRQLSAPEKVLKASRASREPLGSVGCRNAPMLVLFRLIEQVLVKISLVTSPRFVSSEANVISIKKTYIGVTSHLYSVWIP